MKELFIFLALFLVCANAQGGPGRNEATAKPPMADYEVPPNEVCEHHQAGDNPCEDGMECYATKDRDGRYIPACRCRRYCKPMSDRRFAVCSSQNETFSTLCDLDRHKCMCEKRESGCEGQRGTANLAYFGRCKATRPCHVTAKDQFPDRVKQWVELSVTYQVHMGHVKTPLHVAAVRRAIGMPAERRYVPCALWIFCDLDKNSDGRLSYLEYRFFRADLIRVEECIDEHFGRDKDMSFSDWGKAFGIEGQDLISCDRLGEGPDKMGGRGGSRGK